MQPVSSLIPCFEHLSLVIVQSSLPIYLCPSSVFCIFGSGVLCLRRISLRPILHIPSPKVGPRPP